LNSGTQSHTGIVRGESVTRPNLFGPPGTTRETRGPWGIFMVHEILGKGDSVASMVHGGYSWSMEDIHGP
jgi:hypothetical protein